MNNLFNDDSSVITHFQYMLLGLNPSACSSGLFFFLLLMARPSKVGFSVVEMRISKTVIKEIDQSQKREEGGS